MKSAGVLLRTARRSAGLSQVELARRAGVAQSVISAYESGTRQPSLVTLERLIAATGAELEVQVTMPAASPGPPGALGARVRQHREEILASLHRFGLSNPRIFGSVRRAEDHEGSDIDLLVDVGDGVGLVTLARCQAELEALLGAPVDLVPAAALKHGVADRVLQEAVAL